MNVICQIFNSISLLRPTAHLRAPPAPALCQKANGIFAHFHKFFVFEKLIETNLNLLSQLKNEYHSLLLEQRVDLLERAHKVLNRRQCLMHAFLIYICTSFDLPYWWIRPSKKCSFLPAVISSLI